MSLSLNNVVRHDACIGCGACTSVLSSKSTTSLQDTDIYRPRIFPDETQEDLNLASSVCPFSDDSLNEDQIADSTFPIEQLSHNEFLGYYNKTYSGYSIEERKNGASGGIITWLLKKMLSEKIVDYVITVVQTNTEHSRFEYVITNDIQLLEKSGGSAYYPVSMGSVMKEIKEIDGKFAFVGIPCFHKALRLLRQNDPSLDQKIKYQIGLVCGHLKTKEYVDYLIRLTGKRERDIKKISFRRKLEGFNSNEYFFEATDNNDEVTLLNNKKIGNNWGMGAFKPKACDFCDDVYAETADFVSMDAWLPQYLSESEGISLFLSRNHDLDNFLTEGVRNDELVVNEVSHDELIQSQAGGIRHRRKGLSYRLSLKKNKWKPKKRVEVKKDVGFWFKVVQLERMFLRDYSKALFKVQRKVKGILIYQTLMWPAKFVFKVTNKFYRSADSKSTLK